MKKIILSVLCCLLATTSVSAQRNKSNSRPQPKNNEVELTVLANRNERFTVYIDGVPQSNKSGSKFTIYDITPNQMHDVAVVVERPIRYLLYTEVSLRAGKYEMEVYADSRDKYAELYFTEERPTRGAGYRSTRHHYADNYGHDNRYGTHTTPPVPPQPAVPQYCSETDIAVIISSVSKEPFDDTRLNYLKTVTVAKQPFLVEQIKRIAEKFAFDNPRMEYVQYAYQYCIDPENYFTLTDLFVHKSDKDKLLKFIQDNQRRK